MRRLVREGGWVVGLLVLFALAACNIHQGRPPAAGEVITPKLLRPLRWTAGQPGHLQVRVQAHGKDGSGARFLGFEQLPAEANPTVTVTFQSKNGAQAPVEAVLDHRC